MLDPMTDAFTGSASPSRAVDGAFNRSLFDLQERSGGQSSGPSGAAFGHASASGS